MAVTTNSRFAPPRAAYVHVPFCRHRCGYCNFTVVAGRDDLVEAYLQAIARELSWLDTPREVDTLFIGGGTPTHLSCVQLRQLCTTATQWFPLAEGHEFSVEANPLDLTLEKADLLASCGVNRISLGAQSFSASKLALLERDHRAEQVVTAFEVARESMRSVSIDLIFGAPGESQESWENDLRLALDLSPDHLSTYGLTFERGTSFWSRLQKSELSQVAEEDERRMYLAAIDLLTQAGFEHYEVSNFAKPGHRCRHNEVYWAGHTYFAAGPGAARHVDGRRETNHRSTTTYLNRVLADQSPVAESENLNPEDSARERLVFGLRRLEGVDQRSFAAATGFEIDQLVGKSLAELVSTNLLEDTGSRIRLTRQGLLVSDSIWPTFLCR
ncbi:MAG: radical SAM family heme chaperone HemW [Planctomycetota bacterium]|nr:radical SAM family heme chaperone HemW [Planctomycetota bacterium]